jgi:soluble lytic murein transglycosylase-like protein
MFALVARAGFSCAQKKTVQSAAWAFFARTTTGGFASAAHRTLTVFGIIAIGILSLMFIKPDFADHFKKISPFTQETRYLGIAAAPKTTQQSGTPPEATVATEDTRQYPETAAKPLASSKGSQVAVTSQQQKSVTNWLSKRYRVAGDAANMLVSAAYVTAKEVKLDPLLILAVMAIESGLNPFAESPVGAQGLMQVMSKLHHEKFQEMGGVKAALNPVANIKVGSLILKDYVSRGGSIEAGLKMYVGAAAFDTDFGYGSRVLAEYRRLKDVSMGKKVAIFTTTAGAARLQNKAIEYKTMTQNDAKPAAKDTQDKNSKNDQVAAL